MLKIFNKDGKLHADALFVEYNEERIPLFIAKDLKGNIRGMYSSIPILKDVLIFDCKTLVFLC